jgi:hypothetical protein
MKAAVLIAGLFLGACATVPLFEPREWTATLTGTPGHEEVRASARAASGFGRTAVAINLAGGEAGGAHPWHVHTGACGSGGGIVGPANAYPLLRPGTGGSAAASAEVRVELMPDQQYHVNVHRSEAQMETIIACGDLR